MCLYGDKPIYISKILLFNIFVFISKSNSWTLCAVAM